jgi:hypothetical protein
VMLKISIQEALGLTVVWDAIYPDWSFFWFSWVPSGKCWDTTLIRSQPPPPPLVALQPCRGFGFFHGLWRFSNSRFLRGNVSPMPSPQPVGPGLYFIWPLPFDLCGMGGSIRNWCCPQHSQNHFLLNPLYDT